MAKSLLILMLVTTHLLAGNGNSFYLCIGNDGSYSIHAESDTHTSRKVAPKVDCHSCCDSSLKEQCSAPGGKRPVNGLMPLADDCPTFSESCGCTHIPIVMASDQPTRSGRNSIAMDFEQLHSLVVRAPSIDVARQSLFRISLHSYDSSMIPDLILTVISTVVICC